LIDVSDIGNA